MNEAEISGLRDRLNQAKTIYLAPLIWCTVVVQRGADSFLLFPETVLLWTTPIKHSTTQSQFIARFASLIVYWEALLNKQRLAYHGTGAYSSAEAMRNLVPKATLTACMHIVLQLHTQPSYAIFIAFALKSPRSYFWCLHLVPITGKF